MHSEDCPDRVRAGYRIRERLARIAFETAWVMLPLAYYPASQNPHLIAKRSFLLFFVLFGVLVAPSGRIRLGFYRGDPAWLRISLPLFGLALAWAVATSLDPLDSLLGNYWHGTGFLSMIAVWVLFLQLPWTFQRRRDWQRLCLEVLWIYFVIGVLGLLEFQGIHLLPWEFHHLRTRPGVTLYHTNHFGDAMSSAWIASVIVLFCIRSRKIRILALTAMPVYLFGILAAYSRASWLACLGFGVLALPAAFILSGRSRRLSLATRFVIVILFSLLVIGYTLGELRRLPAEHAVKANISEDLMTITRRTVLGRLGSSVDSKELTVRTRYQLYDMALKAFRERPWTGFGLDQFGRAYLQYRSNQEVRDYGANAICHHAHNILLHALATGGIPLFIAWLLFLTGSAWQILRRCLAGGSTDERVLWALILAGWLAFLGKRMLGAQFPASDLLLFLIPGAALWANRPVPVAAKRSPLFEWGIRITSWILLILLLAYGIADALHKKALDLPPGHKTAAFELLRQAGTIAPYEVEFARFHLMAVTQCLAEADSNEKKLQWLGKGIDIIRQVKALHPDDVFMTLNECIFWSEAANSLNHPEFNRLALSSARCIVQIAPNHPTAHAFICQILTREQDHPRALEAIDRALEVEPANGFYLCLKGTLLALLDDWSGATRVFKEACGADDPEVRASAFNNLGICQRKGGDMESARQSFAEAVRLMPSNSVFQDNLGNIEKVLEKNNENGARH